MQTNNQKNLGSFIKQYKFGGPLKFLMPFVIILFFSVGVFFSWVYFSFLGDQNTSSINFKGDLNVILMIALAFIAVGAICLIWYVCFRQKIQEVSLYSEGLTIRNKKECLSCRFEEIADVYDFYDGRNAGSKGLSFHTEKSDKWWHINMNLSGYYELRGLFNEKLIEQKAPILLEQLRQGKTVIFHQIPNMSSRLKSKVMTLSFNLKEMNKIFLTSSTLTIDNNTFQIKEIDNLKDNIWTDKMYINNAAGQTLYSTHVSAILSAPLLHALLIALKI